MYLKKFYEIIYLFCCKEVSAQLSLIDVLLSLDKTIAPCTNKKNEKKEEETQDAMPDSTTNTEKSNANPFHCGDDVLVPNKDGRYYLGTLCNNLF